MPFQKNANSGSIRSAAKRNDPCRGIQLLVDGAHSIGQVPLDLAALGPDYLVTNVHKWMFGPKGSALLYVNKKHSKNVHPLVISHGYGMGLVVSASPHVS